MKSDKLKRNAKDICTCNEVAKKTSKVVVTRGCSKKTLDNVSKMIKFKTKSQKEFFEVDLEELKQKKQKCINADAYIGTIVAVENCKKTYLLKIKVKDIIHLCYISKRYGCQPQSFLLEVLEECEDASSENLIGRSVYFERQEYITDDGELASAVMYITESSEDEVWKFNCFIPENKQEREVI